MKKKRNGVREWVFQRASNLLIISYLLVYVILILSMDDVNYANWSALHSALWFKVYSTFTLIVAMANAILAGWQIGTDYTQKVPIRGFATIFHCFYISITNVFLAFGLFVLWW
jgi:succinate dehydrogenase hydrophobic membrane anchor protein